MTTTTTTVATTAATATTLANKRQERGLCQRPFNGHHLQRPQPPLPPKEGVECALADHGWVRGGVCTRGSMSEGGATMRMHMYMRAYALMVCLRQAGWAHLAPEC